MSQGMFDLDLRGRDWNGQLKWGTSAFYGANYFQSVTPHLALGGELFYLAEQRRSGAPWGSGAAAGPRGGAGGGEAAVLPGTCKPMCGWAALVLPGRGGCLVHSA